MNSLDATHDPSARSWVASAEGHPDFPLQNLPLGVFRPDGASARAGVAIGDEIVDLSALADAGLIPDEAAAAIRADGSSRLNALLGSHAGVRVSLRRALFSLLSEGSAEAERVRALLFPAGRCAVELPAAIGDYTDFYVGIHHATNIGKLFRPDNPLLPNYKHIPIGYHGRASSILASGTAIRRPRGQLKRDGGPEFALTERLDYELELGLWIGPGNALGSPIPIGEAGDHLAGLCLLNDWSARDIQAWEYQPLGPFLAKNFATTISPWIVTAEALAPFRVEQPARPDGDPEPLPYLSHASDAKSGAFAIELEVLMSSRAMRGEGLAPLRLATSAASHMYWTAAQLIAHHSSGGCNLRPGDLLGTGTISGSERPNVGSLMEATAGGREPIKLPTGEARYFVEDGDEILLRGRCRADGFASIGFGECRAIVEAVDSDARA